MHAAAPDVGVKAKEPVEIPWRSISIGAGAGALALGIVGFLLGGPAGALMGALVGGMMYGGVMALRHQVI